MNAIQPTYDMNMAAQVYYNDVLSFNQAAYMLDMKPGTLTNKLKEYPHYKNGSKVLFLKSELVEWIKQHRITPEIEIENEANSITQKLSKVG